MDPTLIVTCVFWTSLTAVGYVYVGYPLLIWLLAKCFGHARVPAGTSGSQLPPITLLLAAYNEEAVIEQWLTRALAIDYPAHLLDILVASDGSSDRTPQIVTRYASQGVRLLDYPLRRGKAAVLRSAYREARGNIVVLSDANTLIQPNAVRKLVRWFADERVGVVCGRLDLTDSPTGRNADGLYWRYENFLKSQEDRLGVLLGANGGLYALRRELEPALAINAIVDDFVIPLRAKILTGCRLIYDPTAVACEETPSNLRDEFHRRSRLGAGGFQSLAQLWPLLHPRHGWTAFAFLSHKVLRWLCPFFLLALLISNVCLLRDPLYCCAQVGQLGFYALAAAAPLVPAGRPRLKPLRLPAMFTCMNAALLVGFFRWLRGRQHAAWQRTARPTEA